MPNNPAIQGLKAVQNRIKEAIEGVKIRRLQVKLATENQGLETDKFRQKKAEVGTRIAAQQVTNERHKLTTAKLQGQQAILVNQCIGDQIVSGQIERHLNQQGLAAKLQLKAIEVASLREEVRTQRVMNGDGVSLSDIKAKLPTFGGKSDV